MFFSKFSKESDNIKSYINFKNYSKTSPLFLESLKRSSSGVNDLLENLMNTELFKSAEVEVDKINRRTIFLVEKFNSFKINYSRSGGCNLSIKIPNLFFNGEIFQFETILPSNLFNKQKTSSPNEQFIDFTNRLFKIDNLNLKLKKPFIINTSTASNKPFNPFNSFNSSFSNSSTTSFSNSSTTSILNGILNIKKYCNNVQNKKLKILNGSLSFSSFPSPKRFIEFGIEQIKNEKLNSKVNLFSKSSFDIFGFNLVANFKYYYDQSIKNISVEGEINKGKEIGKEKEKEINEVEEINEEEESNEEEEIKNNIKENIENNISKENVNKENYCDSLKQLSKISIDSFIDFKSKIKENANTVYNKTKVTPCSLKIQIDKVLSLNFNPFIIESKLSIGKLFFFNSKKPLYDLFFLNKVRGYKNGAIGPKFNSKSLGGTCYGLINSKIGLNLSNFAEVFCFIDVGANTQQGIKSTISKMFDRNEKESTCLGKSIGFGISLKKSLSFLYSVPLTSNLETENFTIGMELSE